jgi:predicted dithiol-disulfide oxidoreductase (DUF899 family)
MNTPPIVSRREWESARKEMLVTEEWEDSPEGYPQTPPYGWWHLHDEYGAAG